MFAIWVRFPIVISLLQAVRFDFFCFIRQQGVLKGFLIFLVKWNKIKKKFGM